MGMDWTSRWSLECVVELGFHLLVLVGSLVMLIDTC
jgi:hypothetical protein